MSTTSQLPATSSDSMRDAPNVTQTPKRNILDLPQELLDIIFGYAYASLAEAKLIRTEPHRRGRMRTSSAKQERKRSTPDSNLKVDEWFVSKKWFVAAATAYIESQVIPVATVGYGMSRCRLLEALGTSFHVSSLNSHYFNSEKYPRMRRLHLQLSPYLDWKEDAKAESIDSVSDDQIMKMVVFNDLKAVRGLQELRITSNNEVREYLQETPEDTAAFEVNVKRMEDLAWPFLSRERVSVEYDLDEDYGLPELSYYCEKVEALYDGSSVCMHTSRTVDEVAMDLWSADLREVMARRAGERKEMRELTKQLSNLSIK